MQSIRECSTCVSASNVYHIQTFLKNEWLRNITVHSPLTNCSSMSRKNRRMCVCPCGERVKWLSVSSMIIWKKRQGKKWEGGWVDMCVHEEEVCPDSVRWHHRLQRFVCLCVCVGGRWSFSINRQTAVSISNSGDSREDPTWTNGDLKYYTGHTPATR